MIRPSSAYTGTRSRWLASNDDRFFYKPLTLSALGVGLAVLAYVATTQDVLEEGQDKRRVYVFLFNDHCPSLIYC
jgi:hypothetical protein